MLLTKKSMKFLALDLQVINHKINELSELGSPGYNQKSNGLSGLDLYSIKQKSIKIYKLLTIRSMTFLNLDHLAINNKITDLSGFRSLVN